MESPCTGNKRQRSASSQSGISPDHKKKIVEINSPADVDKLVNFYKQPPLKMDDFDNLESSPLVKKIWEKLCAVEGKIDQMAMSQKLLEEKITKVDKKCTDTEAKAAKLEHEVSSLTKENTHLRKKLSDSEAYSKKYNLKLFNVVESSNEDTGMLMSKVAGIFSVMGLDLKRMYIDNIHRLPQQGKGPRPVIIKFVSFLDRNLVWQKRDILRQRGCEVTIREHFTIEIEANIRKLLPVRRAALDQNLEVTMSGDKLKINRQTYTVNTLNLLPESLRPENISLRSEGNYRFFFTGASPLSNWHPSTFTLDGVTYSCAEQYLMARKAHEFGDNEAKQKVMNALHPNEMKMYGSQVKGYSEHAWHQKAQDIAERGLVAKFQQNTGLREFLLKTEDCVLVEASKSDRFWGIGRGLYDPKILDNRGAWGQNILGQTLMAVRRTLKNEQNRNESRINANSELN